MTGANCFHVQVDSGVNGTYLTNRDNAAAVKNMSLAGREVIRYDSSQVKPLPQAPVFKVRVFLFIYK